MVPIGGQSLNEADVVLTPPVGPDVVRAQAMRDPQPLSARKLEQDPSLV